MEDARNRRHGDGWESKEAEVKEEVEDMTPRRTGTKHAAEPLQVRKPVGNSSPAVDTPGRVRGMGSDGGHALSMGTNDRSQSDPKDAGFGDARSAYLDLGAQGAPSLASPAAVTVVFSDTDGAKCGFAGMPSPTRRLLSPTKGKGTCASLSTSCSPSSSSSSSSPSSCHSWKLLQGAVRKITASRIALVWQEIVREKREVLAKAAMGELTASSSLLHQGDVNMYTPGAQLKRRRMRCHPGIVDAIKSLWAPVTAHQPRGKKNITRHAFIEFHMVCAEVLLDGNRSSKAISRRARAGGHGSMLPGKEVDETTRSGQGAETGFEETLHPKQVPSAHAIPATRHVGLATGPGASELGTRKEWTRRKRAKQEWQRELDRRWAASSPRVLANLIAPGLCPQKDDSAAPQTTRPDVRDVDLDDPNVKPYRKPRVKYPTLSYADFFACVFELVDTWCTTTKPSEYIQLCKELRFHVAVAARRGKFVDPAYKPRPPPPRAPGRGLKGGSASRPAAWHGGGTTFWQPLPGAASLHADPAIERTSKRPIPLPQRSPRHAKEQTAIAPGLRHSRPSPDAAGALPVANSSRKKIDSSVQSERRLDASEGTKTLTAVALQSFDDVIVRATQTRSFARAPGRCTPTPERAGLGALSSGHREDQPAHTMSHMQAEKGPARSLENDGGLGFEVETRQLRATRHVADGLKAGGGCGTAPSKVGQEAPTTSRCFTPLSGAAGTSRFQPVRSLPLSRTISASVPSEASNSSRSSSSSVSSGSSVSVSSALPSSSDTPRTGCSTVRSAASSACSTEPRTPQPPAQSDFEVSHGRCSIDSARSRDGKPGAKPAGSCGTGNASRLSAGMFRGSNESGRSAFSDARAGSSCEPTTSVVGGRQAWCRQSQPFSPISPPAVQGLSSAGTARPDNPAAAPLQDDRSILPAAAGSAGRKGRGDTPPCSSPSSHLLRVPARAEGVAASTRRGSPRSEVLEGSRSGTVALTSSPVQPGILRPTTVVSSPAGNAVRMIRQQRKGGTIAASGNPHKTLAASSPGSARLSGRSGSAEPALLGDPSRVQVVATHSLPASLQGSSTTCPQSAEEGRNHALFGNGGPVTTGPLEPSSDRNETKPSSSRISEIAARHDTRSGGNGLLAATSPLLQRTASSPALAPGSGRTPASSLPSPLPSPLQPSVHLSSLSGSPLRTLASGGVGALMRTASHNHLHSPLTARRAGCDGTPLSPALLQRRDLGLPAHLPEECSSSSPGQLLARQGAPAAWPAKSLGSALQPAPSSPVTGFTMRTLARPCGQGSHDGKSPVAGPTGPRASHWAMREDYPSPSGLSVPRTEAGWLPRTGSRLRLEPLTVSSPQSSWCERRDAAGSEPKFTTPTAASKQPDVRACAESAAPDHEHRSAGTTSIVSPSRLAHVNKALKDLALGA